MEKKPLTKASIKKMTTAELRAMVESKKRDLEEKKHELAQKSQDVQAPFRKWAEKQTTTRLKAETRKMVTIVQTKIRKVKRAAAREARYDRHRMSAVPWDGGSGSGGWWGGDWWDDGDDNGIDMHPTEDADLEGMSYEAALIKSTDQLMGGNGGAGGVRGEDCGVYELRYLTCLLEGRMLEDDIVLLEQELARREAVDVGKPKAKPGGKPQNPIAKKKRRTAVCRVTAQDSKDAMATLLAKYPQ